MLGNNMISFSEVSIAGSKVRIIPGVHIIGAAQERVEKLKGNRAAEAKEQQIGDIAKTPNVAKMAFRHPLSPHPEAKKVL